MNKIFEPIEVAGITFSNRIIRSATFEGTSDKNGKPTEQCFKKYEALARGGVGGIITGFIGVSQQGKASDNMAMLDKDENIEAFLEITNKMHELGTPVIAQLNHAGGQSKEKSSHMPVVAPSKIKDYKANEMTNAEILDVIEAFVSAIKRAKQAGFDGVQVHVAHGYLLSEFVSPRMNTRVDEWGKNTQNRFRILKMIFENARKEVGSYPIIVKINGYETLKDGMTIEESIKIAKLLEQVGCDGIEVSNGTLKAGMATMRGQVPWKMIVAQNEKLNKMPVFMQNFIGVIANKAVPQPHPLKLYNEEAAVRIKKAVNIPVILVGGITKIEEIKDLIETEKCDVVSMCRPFIIEPDIVNKFKAKKQTESKCIQCNFCIIAVEEKPLKCYYGKVPKSN